MINTCRKEECPLWKKYKETCPNYTESWWTTKDNGDQQLVFDCTPKRILLMLQNLHNRMIGVEKSQEEQRNEVGKFFEVIKYQVSQVSSTRPMKNIESIEERKNNAITIPAKT